jgi:capsular polysaccharide biosynthesis protein
MDLGLYARVMWRFKLVVGAGIVLAAVLAFFSFASLSTSGTVSYRQSQKWVSYARLAVSEPGFPQGSLSTANIKADSSRLAGLAVYYANFADTDPVARLMRRKGPIHGVLEVAPVTATPGSTDALPLISIAAIAGSPQVAEELAGRQALALRDYVIQQQNGNRIAVDNRVVLNLVKTPATATIFQARSTTLPIVVFLTVLMAAMGLAFVLENLRPRIRDESWQARADSVRAREVA